MKTNMKIFTDLVLPLSMMLVSFGCAGAIENAQTIGAMIVPFLIVMVMVIAYPIILKITDNE